LVFLSIRVEDSSEERAFESNFDVKADDVFGEAEIVVGSGASPVGVVEELDADAWVGDVSEADLCAEGVELVMPSA
jgi:hypothetical protein